jgi:hypothetical protein
MTKFITSTLMILISFLTAINQVITTTEVVQPPVKAHRTHWLTNPSRNRHELLKTWLENKRVETPSDSHLKSLSTNLLHPPQRFKGCIDPSEPFQCPKSERCIALQFICDGHPGDCPENLDENEETCIATKRPAKDNIEKFFQAAYAIHGIEFFTFLFGETVAKKYSRK